MTLVLSVRSGNHVKQLLFDDEAFNNVVRIEVGVAFELVLPRTQGLTWQIYKQGLGAWARGKSVTILQEPSFRKRVLIGFSGLPPVWINLVQKGEGTVDRTMAYRWGYGLYIASSFGIAKFFADDVNTIWTAAPSQVCEVWVKDYDLWATVNKIWVPENYSPLPQMSNESWSEEMTGRNQEARNRYIGDTWKVRAPYVLFSKHFYMANMPVPAGQRWSEMLVPTQIQRSLIELVPLPASMVTHPNPEPFPFPLQARAWNITVPPQTQLEFMRNSEPQIH